MSSFHKKLAGHIREKGLMEKWSNSPSYQYALELLGSPVYGMPRKEMKKMLAEIISEKGETSPKKPSRTAGRRIESDEFLASFEWRRVRMAALRKYGPRCMCCGATPRDGLMMHVDHIKPRKVYPELALSLDNLQILCEVCNHGKGNWDMTDWRPGFRHVMDCAAGALNHSIELSEKKDGVTRKEPH